MQRAQDDQSINENNDLQKEDEIMSIKAPQDNSYSEEAPAEESSPAEPHPEAETSESAGSTEDVHVKNVAEKVQEMIQEEEHKAQQVDAAEEEIEETATIDEDNAVENEDPQQPEEVASEREPELPFPNQSGVNFCDAMKKNASPETGREPAVILLGMEDTSTELLWHTITQLLHPTRSSRTHTMCTHSTRINYEALGKLDEAGQEDFWENVSLKSNGKWLVHVLCQQQQNDLPTGFPWLTNDADLSMDTKALASLEILKTLPQDSVKVIRVKRNFLDVLIRLTLDETKGVSVAFPRYQILKKVNAIKKEQDKMDIWLETNEIPRLVVDFETLFPFASWQDLIQVATGAQAEAVPINTGDLLKTNLERTWGQLLSHLEVDRPLSLFDVLQATMRTHKVKTFWSQTDVIDNYHYVVEELKGTRHSQLLRNLPIKVNHEGNF